MERRRREGPNVIITLIYHSNFRAADEPLTARQKQLLYECEEERMVVKACLRELIKLKKSAKHTSWDTAEAANMSLS